MQVEIRGHNIKITDGIHEYAQEKLGRLDRYLPRIADIRLDLSRQNSKRGGDTTIAQITLRHQRGAILRSEERVPGEDRDAVKAAINLAVDKMYRRIERFKGRQRDSRKAHERYIATEEELTLAEEIPQEETAVAPVEDSSEPIVVRRKEVPLIGMNEDEAIEQMELLGHNFFMFYNASTGQINVLYRRSDGGYGVLLPQIE
jgi:putative sigma-54 modulation protein